jgi:hypothetical protein
MLPLTRERKVAHAAWLELDECLDLLVDVVLVPL